MFQEQVQRLSRLANLVPKDSASWMIPILDEMKAVFGNCQALTHRAPVAIRDTLPPNATMAGVLQVANYNNPDGTDTNGYAIYVEEGRVNFGSGAQVVQWAVATADWTNVAGNGSYVDCNKASDSSGTLSGGTVRVFLPRVADRDPNVRSGDIIAYSQDTNGIAVCASDYLDDKIGTIKATSEASAPPGWSIIASGKTLFGFASLDADFGTLGGTGGAKTHTHTFSGITLSGSTDGTNLDNHDASHAHDISATATFETGGLSDFLAFPPPLPDPATDVETLILTHSPNPHTHTFSGASGSGSTASASHLPPYLVVNWIQRVD